MKSVRMLYLMLLASLAVAVAAQAFGYGGRFAATTLATQMPLLAVMFFFARVAESSGRKKSFIGVSLLLLALFLASGVEDASLCLRFGSMHASDSGFARWGISGISVLLLAIATAAWIHVRVKEPNQPQSQCRLRGMAHLER